MSFYTTRENNTFYKTFLGFGGYSALPLRASLIVHKYTRKSVRMRVETIEHASLLGIKYASHIESLTLGGPTLLMYSRCVLRISP